jgi:hypothetical protein
MTEWFKNNYGKIALVSFCIISFVCIVISVQKECLKNNGPMERYTCSLVAPSGQLYQKWEVKSPFFPVQRVCINGAMLHANNEKIFIPNG